MAIRGRLRWTRTERAQTRWTQAFSTGAGQTWETNWVMDFTRAAPVA